MKPTEKLEAFFYRSGAGVEPVRDWLKGLNAESRKAIGKDIRTAQYGWPLGMPLICKLGSGLGSPNPLAGRDCLNPVHCE